MAWDALLSERQFAKCFGAVELESDSAHQRDFDLPVFMCGFCKEAAQGLFGFFAQCGISSSYCGNRSRQVGFVLEAQVFTVGDQVVWFERQVFLNLCGALKKSGKGVIYRFGGGQTFFLCKSCERGYS